MSTFLSPAVPVDPAHLNTMVEALRSVPALADRYAGLPALTGLDDLPRVPVMVKNDLQTALTHLRPRAASGTTWVFQSGGSTGSPMFGYAPTGLYMAEVHARWAPLDGDDIVVNAWSAGKMWGAHYLFNALVDLSGCTAMCLGAIARAEYDAWFEFFAAQGVTAIGGTPSVLRLLFAHARATGVKLPELRKVLWLGEAWDPHLDDDLPAVAPNAGRWGMFGSTETWVVATNTPRCGVDTWHVLPSQLVHVGEDELLDFTSLKPHGLNPVLRYRTGDAGRVVTCSCGDPGPALKILGRRDGLVKFRGHLVSVDDLVDQVTARPGVTRAQLVVHEYPDRGSMLEVLVLPDRDAPPDLAERIRESILASAFGPSIVFQRNPDSLAVSTVDALISNERTGKTSNLVVRREP
jgi:phenylacetate-coenzyme A ligase PaaK-like adenylate-forming protein